MKICSPISRLEEIDILKDSGAEWFYCGVTPREWIDRFTPGIWLNRRGPLGGNLRSIEELAELVKRAHSYGIGVSLTLNAPYYTENQIPFVTKLAREAVVRIGVDEIIIADIGLITALKDLRLGVDIHISSLGNCYNIETARFYKELGAKKITFSRHMNINEIEAIVREVNGIEFEVFILNDGCVFEEGFCHAPHSVDNRLEVFCLTDWEYRLSYRNNGKNLNLNDREGWNTHLSDYQEWLWYMNNCGCSMSINKIPNGPCGLCAIYDFFKMGISSLKIVGRESPTLRKAASVRLVSEIVNMVKMDVPKHEVVEKAKRLRDNPELCNSGYMCYYRDIDSEVNLTSVQ